MVSLGGRSPKLSNTLNWMQPSSTITTGYTCRSNGSHRRMISQNHRWPQPSVCISCSCTKPVCGRDLPPDRAVEIGLVVASIMSSPHTLCSTSSFRQHVFLLCLSWSHPGSGGPFEAVAELPCSDVLHAWALRCIHSMQGLCSVQGYGSDTQLQEAVYSGRVQFSWSHVLGSARS